MSINHDFIYKLLEETKNPRNEEIKEVLEKAKKEVDYLYIIPRNILSRFL